MREDGTIDVEAAHAKAATTNVDMDKAKEVINKCKDLGEFPFLIIQIKPLLSGATDSGFPLSAYSRKGHLRDRRQRLQLLHQEQGIPCARLSSAIKRRTKMLLVQFCLKS